MTDPLDELADNLGVPREVRETDMNHWAGPVITLPEDLTPEQLSTIPNPPTERTATALLQLLTMTAEQFDVDEARLVQVAGALRDNGAIGLYRLLPAPGSADTVGWAATWYLEDVFGGELYLTATSEEAEELAKVDYDRQAEDA